MYLPPSASAKMQGHQSEESRKLRLIKLLSNWNAYGFWFCLGLTAANFTRFIPHSWVVYVAIKASLAGYLILVKPKDASPETIALRRINGLALSVSVVAFWDVAVLVAILPISIGNWILPLWLCMVATVAAILIAGVFVFSSVQKR